MPTEAIERDEWLLLLGMIADVRAELRVLNERLLGDDPNDEADDDDA